MSKPTYAQTKANKDRQTRAEAALDAYKAANGTRGYAEDEDVQDLLTDLAHLLAHQQYRLHKSSWPAWKYRQFVWKVFSTALSDFESEADGMNGVGEVEE